MLPKEGKPSAALGKHALPVAIHQRTSFLIKSIPDAYRPGFWPENFDFTHYEYVINRIPTLGRNMLNSVIVTTSTVVITTICAVLGGYALVRQLGAGRGRAVLEGFEQPEHAIRLRHLRTEYALFRP